MSSELVIFSDVPPQAAVTRSVEPGHRLVGVTHDGASEFFSRGDAPGTLLDWLTNGRMSTFTGSGFKRFYHIDMRQKTIEKTYKLSADSQGAYEFTSNLKLNVHISEDFLRGLSAEQSVNKVDRWMGVDLSNQVDTEIERAMIEVARAFPPTDDGNAEREAQGVLQDMKLIGQMLTIASARVSFTLDAAAKEQIRQFVHTNWSADLYEHGFSRQAKLRQIFEEYIPFDYPNRKLVGLKLANDPKQLPAFIDRLEQNQSQRSGELANVLEHINQWIESGKLDSVASEAIAQQLIRATSVAPPPIQERPPQQRLADEIAPRPEK
jgi:hypothetical protein